MVTIRHAVVEDVPAMLEMLRDSACDQGFPDEVCVTQDDLVADGFGEHRQFCCLIGEWNGEVAGLALFFFIYSSWGSKTVLYLEDLYVKKAFRNKGIARSLLARLADVAARKGCGRMQWVVHNDNDDALRFYRSMGASRLTNWTIMSLKDDAIARLVIS